MAREKRAVVIRGRPGKGGQLEPRRYNDWPAEAELPICCVGCCPSQLPAVIMCVCVPVDGVAVGTCPTHTHTGAALRQAVRGSLGILQPLERKGGMYLEDLTLRGCRDKARPYLTARAVSGDKQKKRENVG